MTTDQPTNDPITYRGVTIPDDWAQGLDPRAHEIWEYGLLGFMDGVDAALGSDSETVCPDCAGRTADMSRVYHPWLHGSEVFQCPGVQEETDDASA
jgi:hypothetical protein